MRVLITGGAGFIGCHLSRALLAEGYEVRILDRFIEQVHGGAMPPDPVLRSVDIVTGDIRDAEAVIKAVDGVDKVVHLAAEVGVGQSMYEIDRYVDVNDLGTAVLLKALLAHPVQRLVVASSMSIYGEGLYQTADGRLIEQVTRQPASGWDPRDEDGGVLTPVPTPEWKRPVLSSVYAITKYTQERLCMNVVPAYGMESVALRMFNVFGAGQALSNPYTGVLAIFAARILNGQSPMVFEDGQQQRDFVHVEDVARAFVLALETPGAAGGVFNVGSGHRTTVEDVARLLAHSMGRSDLAPEFLNKARAGDIRHCFADLTLSRDVLGFVPKRSLADGVPELAEWLARQTATDRVLDARKELEARGLVA
ncbi:SDR family NAD(P)-dependent oxidoreductase [Acidisoma cladoniae]|uniref:SDR family NAD(P)-dependent oxidoreductase n=1 Tax=Acidisoma cladoniae TaxID=3040935 RepID=UPI00254B939D|nr:SDR family NAD(P)-dependent oxidoreductase [Acidisoma sp. PAMC 29798]